MTTGKLNINTRKLLVTLGLVVSAVSASLWFFSTDYPLIIKNRYFSSPIENYMSVNIGDKREDVMYKLGSPGYVFGEQEKKCGKDFTWECGIPIFSTNEAEEGIPKISKELKNYNVYIYSDGPLTQKFVSVYFDKKDQVVKIGCKVKCEKRLGVGINSREDEIRRLIGNPSNSEIDANSGVKTLSYTKLNLKLYLTKMKVYMVEVGPT